MVYVLFICNYCAKLKNILWDFECVLGVMYGNFAIPMVTRFPQIIKHKDIETI